MRITKLLIITAAIAIQACSNLPPKISEDTGATATVAVKHVPAVTHKAVSTPVTGTENTQTERSTIVHAAATQERQYDNIWERISDNLSLDRHTGSRRVQGMLAWYRRNQDFLDRTADRAAPYIYYIVQELDKRDMPLDLALLPIIESAYHPFAYSPSHASGIWQFIPSTGRLYGLKQNWWYDGRRDIVASTRAALDYLEKLHNQFNGDWLLALAAYNSGELNVTRAIRKNAMRGKKTDFWSLHLPRETRGYVPSLLAVAELVKKPRLNHIKLKPIPNQPYFSKVDIGGQVDLALAADLADLTMDEIYTLNPGFNQWATDPEGPNVLLVPVAKKEEFSKKLAAIDERDRIGWKRHIIKPGESLNLIAGHYNTSAATLKQINNLHTNLIRTGHSLLIPASKQPLKHYTLSVTSRRYRGLQKASGEKYLYTVRRGDTLWDIGRNYGVSIQSLLAWNNLSKRDYLHPGQKLNIVISDSGQTAADDDSPSTDTNNIANRENTIDYTIRSGDSLWLIAKRYQVNLQSLQKINGLTSGAVLYPGQKLTIKLNASGAYPVSMEEQGAAPVNYTVRKGDSLWVISRRFGTTVDKLRRWNKLPKGKVLQPGEVLVLYVQEV